MRKTVKQLVLVLSLVVAGFIANADVVIKVPEGVHTGDVTLPDERAEKYGNIEYVDLTSSGELRLLALEDLIWVLDAFRKAYDKHPDATFLEEVIESIGLTVKAYSDSLEPEDFTVFTELQQKEDLDKKLAKARKEAEKALKKANRTLKEVKRRGVEDEE